MSTLPGFALVVLLLSASSAAADELALKMDPELGGSAATGRQGPMFLSADRIESTAPNIIEASGSVEARQGGQNFFANWLRYDTTLNLVEARGEVRLEQPALLVSGDSLRLDLDDYSGELTQPVYQLIAQPGRGDADHVDFIDENRFKLQDATYTTCPVDNDDWFLKVADLDIDKTRNVGTARNASLRFLGVPILYTPWMDFSLNDERKTGVLAPTIGTTERSGFDLLVPYYLNLAPNYDATLYPRLLSKRGVQLGGEFRYLLNDVRGENRLEYLPNDNEAGRSRWSAALSNIYRLNANTEAGMLFNRVSDDDYFRDLSNLISITSLSHLNREAWVTTQHANWNAELRAQSFQTLQDSTAAPILEPYARLPQARFGMAQIFGSGLEFRLDSEATRFAHPDPTKPEGSRVLAYPTLRMPLTNSFGFLTPQIGWHGTYYALDDSAPEQRITRNLPIFSLDSGVTFDRPFRFAGQDYEQTLEPRAYYVFAPFRDQSAIPVFDTALQDFSYAQMFTENQFIGGDRVNDANQLTLAVTSRFTEAESGLERLQVTLGQRYYFSAQQVTLPGVAPRTSNATDLLAAVSGQITRDWRIDTAWQFDTQNGTTVRQNLGASYRPAPGRALNFNYRFIDQTTEQVDLSGQWPLGDRWYGMFRYNYSFQDNKLVEGLAGVEYNGGCWAVRAVFQRLATKEDQSTDALFFQLELNGMGRLGANPLDVLQQSVPGYRPSNEILQTP
ncbi:MAG: LPS-assembly protein LptD [Gammaproteobacteria bacterium]|nr:LPS-assembly protein LptD [Gammaproteobacteria bacterium]MBU1408377.1 LPS-assembly protein LptD [Gammaproteobacteria bacterium]MBU1532189.1 LPS-assembly protein LptD [Gammaproteobacteria bacterium]